MIRSLTSTLSNDQRELERSRLQKGYEDSEYVIDRLLQGIMNFYLIILL